MLMTLYKLITGADTLILIAFLGIFELKLCNFHLEFTQYVIAPQWSGSMSYCHQTPFSRVCVWGLGTRLPSGRHATALRAYLLNAHGTTTVVVELWWLVFLEDVHALERLRNEEASCQLPSTIQSWHTVHADNMVPPMTFCRCYLLPAVVICPAVSEHTVCLIGVSASGRLEVVFSTIN